MSEPSVYICSTDVGVPSFGVHIDWHIAVDASKNILSMSKFCFLVKRLARVLFLRFCRCNKILKLFAFFVGTSLS